jgi:hypothetical protein
MTLDMSTKLFYFRVGDHKGKLTSGAAQFKYLPHIYDIENFDINSFATEVYTALSKDIDLEIMNEFDVSSKEMETLTQDYAITYNDLVSKLFLSDNIIENNIIKGNRFTNFIKNLSSKYAFGFSNKGREGEVEFNKRTIKSVMDALKEASKASKALTKAVNAFNIFDESNSEYNTIKIIILAKL